MSKHAKSSQDDKRRRNREAAARHRIKIQAKCDRLKLYESLMRKTLKDDGGKVPDLNTTRGIKAAFAMLNERINASNDLRSSGSLQSAPSVPSPSGASFDVDLESSSADSVFSRASSPVSNASADLYVFEVGVDSSADPDKYEGLGFFGSIWSPSQLPGGLVSSAGVQTKDPMWGGDADDVGNDGMNLFG